MTAKACLRSMRLRTLPLSLSGIALGVLLAARDHGLCFLTVALLALTTVCLQILSNLSNELGDTLSGTDRADRHHVDLCILALHMQCRTIRLNPDVQNDLSFHVHHPFNKKTLCP